MHLRAALPRRPVEVCGLAVRPGGLASLIACVAMAAILGAATPVRAEGGLVYGVGTDSVGQLGIGDNTLVPRQSLMNGVLLDAQAISAGELHALALKSDGTVWAWGANYDGQLGIGTMAPYSATPVQVVGLTDVKAVAAGRSHSLAIKTDGTVWAWGANGQGQLGDETTVSYQYSPVQVVGLTDVTAIAAGYDHSLAVKSDGTVWGWGENMYGQLGIGITSRHSPLVQVTGLTGAKALAAGEAHSLALMPDGTIWAWGWNPFGQLGDGTSTDRLVPVQVTGLTDATAIAAYGGNSLAVKSDGTAWAWGNNSYGQLGDRNKPYHRSVPGQVIGLTDVSSIGVGYRFCLAVKTDGTVWSWGRNDQGELGDGTFGESSIPVQVTGMSGARAVAGGEYHSVAVTADGNVWAWGRNLEGELGDGTTPYHATLVQVPGVSGVTAIAGNNEFSLALESDGTVWAWGRNGRGVLGDGTNMPRFSPVRVLDLTGVTAVAAGLWHNLALKSDGTVWAWGSNGSGELGAAAIGYDYRPAPVQVSGLTNVTAITAGSGYSLALKGDGTVWAWGTNFHGELGGGTADKLPHPNPVQVANLTNVAAISASGSHSFAPQVGGHSLALKADGTVWAWGPNNHGQLGDGTTTDRLSAVQVFGLTDVAAIVGDSNFSVALKSDRTVWVWGSNGDGQHGNGMADYDPHPIAEPVLDPLAAPGTALTGVAAIAAADNCVLAMMPNHTVLAWGDNSNGQYGDATIFKQSVPLPAPDLIGVRALGAGRKHSLFLRIWPGDFNGEGHVDGDDLAVFEFCVTGPGVAPGLTTTCQAADFDTDGDVDQDDFGVFQRCYSGPNHLADPLCG